MRKLPPRQTAAEQVYQAILDAVSDGSFAPGAHLVQEELAAKLGVSRQPIQQAMAMLKADGIVEESGARGLHVAPIDLATMRHRYAIRSVLDAMAASGAAKAVLAGDRSISDEARRLVAVGRSAIAAMDVRLGGRRHRLPPVPLRSFGQPADRADSRDPLALLRRVMSDVVRHAQPPVEIWDQHEAIVEAIARGDAEAASRLAEAHVERAAERLTAARQRMEEAA